MNKNDEHLIFERLALFDGYLSCDNDSGFVSVIDNMDLEICLQNHPNWTQISKQAPLLVYDCPSFVEQADLLDYFCTLADSKQQLDHICRALNGSEHLDESQHTRSYRLIIYSAVNPTEPIGFSSFDLELSEDIEQEDDINLISLKCDFLYAFVAPEFRDMGVGSVLGMMMGGLFWRQLHYVWSQINESETALVPLIYSENFSRGAQDIIKTVLRELKLFSDAQQQSGSVRHLRSPQLVSAHPEIEEAGH